MNYYSFHIGDYQSHTGHLDPLEDIAYRRMMDWCYLHERDLPLDIERIAKLIRMRSHCDCIEYVLEEFFTETANGYQNTRINKEITKYREKSEKAKESANARWKKEEDANALRPDTEGNANQEPRTKNQEPLTNLKDLSANADCTTATVAPDEPEAVSKVPKADPCPYQKIVDLYHKHLPMCPRVVQITEKRKTAMRARWKNGSGNLDFWDAYFSDVATSKFLTGKVQPSPGRKTFIADIDFLIRPDTAIKMQEGKYHG